MNEIYVTGDLHGDLGRLFGASFPEGKNLDRSDVIEILGDFGLIWETDEDDPKEVSLINQLNDMPWTTIATLGNHENYDRIKKLPVEERFGAPVWVLRDNTVLLQSGYMYKINGRNIWNFNGARSVDISDGILDPADPDFKYKKLTLERNFKRMWRIKGVSWWEDEIEKDPEVYERGIQSLKKNDYKADFIWTHCAPSGTEEKMGFFSHDRLTDYFQEIDWILKKNNSSPLWYFGHYHIDAVPERNKCCLYQSIVRI